MAQRRRVVHVLVRLHELELGGGIQRPGRSRQLLCAHRAACTRRHRAGRDCPLGDRPGAADAFLPATQPLSVHDPRAGGFRRARASLDADDPWEEEPRVRVAQGRLPDGPAGDVHGSGWRLRQPRRPPAHQSASGARRRGGDASPRQGWGAGETGCVRRRPRRFSPQGRTQPSPGDSRPVVQPPRGRVVCGQRRTWPAADVDRLPRSRTSRDLRARAAESVDRLACVGELTMVAPLHPA